MPGGEERTLLDRLVEVGCETANVIHACYGAVEWIFGDTDIRENHAGIRGNEL